MNGNNMILLGSHDHKEFDVNSIKINGLRESSTDPNSYKSLCEYDIQRCEFCDKVSKNRYSSIIHSAQHIIIPLINLKLYQCSFCLNHYKSMNQLNHHLSREHEKMMNTKTFLVNPEPIDVDNYEPVAKPIEHNTKIKNRLVFEEDMEPDVILTDFTTECKVNLELVEAPCLRNEQEWVGRSVGYDELMRPGLYKCKKCSKTFPNRYELIMHETSHLSLKNCEVRQCYTCNSFVVGGEEVLLLHHARAHGQTTTSKCHRCQKTYSDIDKHKIYCPMNSFDCYENKIDYKEYSKIINLCDMCFSFCRSTPLKQYVCVGVSSKLGTRFPCDRCGSLFFEVKIVERKLRFKEKEKKRKIPSNEGRLKNIMQRLKMLK